jgi:hypothetical protein
MFDDCVVGFCTKRSNNAQRKYTYQVRLKHTGFYFYISPARFFYALLLQQQAARFAVLLVLSNGNIESNILKIRMAKSQSFWEYRHEQESLGNSNGLKPFGTKALYATVSPSIRVSFLGVPDTISHLSIVTRRWSWCCIWSI